MTAIELDGRPSTAPAGGPATADRNGSSAPVLAVGGRTVVPVLDGDRPVGLYVVTDRARWYPVRSLGARSAAGPTVAAVAAAAVAVAATSAARGPRSVRQITMGPGGWVSLRGGRPPRRIGRARPAATSWWAALAAAMRRHG